MAKNEIIRAAGNGRRGVCVAHGGLVYLSGLTTVDLEADVAGQAWDVLGQIDRLLALQGIDKHRVLTATVYLACMEDYAAFNAVWDQWVDDGFEPARSVVQAGLALAQYRVKISVTAAL